MTIIEARAFSFKFRDRVIFDHAEFVVDQPGVYGIVAPNGSGKTTFFNLLTGLLPSAQPMLINGQPNTRQTVFDQVAYLDNVEHLAPALRGQDYVDLIVKAHRVSAERQAAVLPLLAVDQFAGKRIGAYSLGMRQRLLLTLVLMIDAPIVLLDEPLNGLDPASLTVVRDAIGRLAAAGRTVLVSSHNLDELARVTSTVFLMRDHQFQAATYRDAAELDRLYGESFQQSAF